MRIGVTLLVAPYGDHTAAAATDFENIKGMGDTAVIAAVVLQRDSGGEVEAKAPSCALSARACHHARSESSSRLGDHHGQDRRLRRLEGRAASAVGHVPRDLLPGDRSPVLAALRTVRRYHGAVRTDHRDLHRHPRAGARDTVHEPMEGGRIIVFAAVYQQIETYVFTPRISKKTMDVNPAIALGAVFVGAAIWGPIGAIIGIPLAAAGVSILDTYRQRYELVPELEAATGAQPVPATPPSQD